MIKEYTKVKTRVEKAVFPEGTTGVIVNLYGDGPAYEVEPWDDNSCPLDVITYTFDELEI